MKSPWSKRDYGLVQVGRVVDGDGKVGVDERNEGGVDHLRLSREDGCVGHISVRDAVRHVDTFKRSVGDVQLVEEGEVLGLAGDGFGLVEAVVTDDLAEFFPVQVDATPSALSERVVAVDARLAVESVRLVGDIEQREAGKLDAGVVRRARLDVRRKERPRIGLRKTGLEPVDRRRQRPAGERSFAPKQRIDGSPLGHRGQALELAEDHLLARLGRNRLQEHLSRGTRVELVEEAVYTWMLRRPLVASVKVSPPQA